MDSEFRCGQMALFFKEIENQMQFKVMVYSIMQKEVFIREIEKKNRNKAEVSMLIKKAKNIRENLNKTFKMVTASKLQMMGLIIKAFIAKE